MVSDETFFAWLDGELAAAEASRVEAEVAADPRLSAFAAEHRQMQETLKGAFDTVADAPLPEHLLAVAHTPPARVINFAEAKKRRRPAAPVRQWAAIAATLAVGVLIGTLAPHARQASPVEVQGGMMYAAATLDDALRNQLARAPHGAVPIGVTFRDQSGELCRSFTDPSSSGLACRDRSGWRLRGLFAAPEGQSSDYRMAAGMDPNRASLVDSTINGEPFDAAREKAAREKGWR